MPTATLAVPARAPARPARCARGVLALALLLALGWLAPGLYESWLAREDFARAVHPDTSAADHGQRAQVRPRVALVYRDADGRSARALVDAAHLSVFLRERIAGLEARRVAVRAALPALLATATDPVFGAMHDRVAGFADWYYGWGTGYRLLAEGAWSAGSHLLSPGVMTLRDAVAHDLTRFVERRYRDQVLRPEASDPALQAAFVTALAAGRAGYLAALEALDTELQAFVASHAVALAGPLEPRDASLTLDWESQRRRIAGAGEGGGRFEPAAGVASVGAGAMVGRAAGAGAGRAVAARLSGTAGRGLAARMAAPHAARALHTAAAAAAGSSGGPLGAVLGGLAGLGVDFALNRAVAAVEQDDFEAQVHRVLDDQAREWRRRMEGAAAGAVDVWFEDLIQLLARQGG